MPVLSQDERNIALGLIQGGISYRQVARRLNCHHSTIVRLVERFNATGSVAPRPRSGQPRVTSNAQDRHFVLSHLRNRFRSATETAAETIGTRGLVHPGTVRNRLRSAGLFSRRPYVGPILNFQRRQQRLNWARMNQYRTLRGYWGSVLFTDESRFTLSFRDGRTRVWRRRGERYDPNCVLERDRFGGGSVHVWGGISLFHRTPLHIFTERVTARVYIDQIIEPIVIPTFQAHQDLRVFQQDNARPHTARITMDVIRQQDFELMPWPPYSPDMSPIEHLWDELGRRVRNNHQITTLRDLQCALQREWQAIPQNFIENLVRSMRSRIRACLDAGGAHTRY